MKGITCILTVLLCFMGTAHADIVCLKDGRIVNGPSMKVTEGGINVLYENGAVFISSDLIMETIIEGESNFTPTSDFEKKQLEKGLVPFQGEWLTPEKRDRKIEKFLEERKAAIADEEAHRLWRNRRMEKTKHFEFEYTVPQHIFEKYRDLMESYYTSFARQWKVRQPKELGRLKVCFYVDREKFEQIGGAGRGAAGYFRFVPPMELNFYYDRIDPEFTEDVMFHETNHYLTKLINVDFMYPHFPGESLAEFYGASDYDPSTKKLSSGLSQEGRLIEIQSDLAAGKKMELRKLIETDAMYQHYNWGWSFVHFLMNHPKYQKKFQKFVIGLAKGKDVDRVRAGGNLETVRGIEILRIFKKYMGIKKQKDFDRLEIEWHSYLEECLQLASTRGKEKAAVAAVKSSPPRKIRAARLFQEAIDEGSTNPLTYYHFAELLSDDGKHEEALKMWHRAIELDPLNPQYYARLGRAVARKGSKEEGARLMKLAVEIDPDYAWTIEAQLGRLLEKIQEG